MEFITDFNIEFHRHLMHLYFQWKKLFYEELSDYTFAAKELDEEKFSLLLLDTTKAPVSYTHLDVYKRQVFIR